MKTRSTNYDEARIRLKELAKHWDVNDNNLHQLDANFVAVKFANSVDWKVAKSAGAKKEPGWGWVLWRGSTNESGSNFAVEVFKIASEYKGLLTRERQL